MVASQTSDGLLLLLRGHPINRGVLTIRLVGSVTTLGACPLRGYRYSLKGRILGIGVHVDILLDLLLELTLGS